MQFTKSRRHGQGYLLNTNTDKVGILKFECYDAEWTEILKLLQNY